MYNPRAVGTPHYVLLMRAVSALTCSLQTMEQEMLHVNKSCITCSNTAHCNKIHKVEKFTFSLILVASIFTAKYMYFKQKEEENEKKELP